MAAYTQRWAPFSLFYPISLALIVAMVALALKPGVERARTWRTVLATIASEGLVVEGEQLRTLVVNERASANLGGPSAAPYAIIGSTGVVSNDQNNGARYWLAADAVRELSGKEIELSFEVRSAPEAVSEDWLVRITIRDVLDTGWLPQRAGPDWSVSRVRLAIPLGDQREPMEIIMWSDATGDSGRIHLRRLGIEPLRTM